MSMPATAAVVPLAAPVTFTGSDGAFRRLVTRGALLELITFGFYRFWITTDIRRHLWSHTEIDGDALEYTGRGTELLVGFLIAMAILGPFFLAYFLLGLEFERFKAFASLPLYLLVIAFGQFAAYRARRYRLTRTVWRGARFWMTGSGWSYAWRSIAWGLLLGPTLGFAYPWRMAALERYKLRHTLYGDLPGRFEANGRQLFKRVWWVWLLGILPFVLFVGSIVAAGVAGAKSPDAPKAGAAPGFIILLAGFTFFALPFLHGIRRAREWAWWSSGIRFGDVAVACDLRSGSLIGIYWKLIGWSVLVILVFGATAGTMTVLSVGAHVTEMAATLLRGQLPWWWIAINAVTYFLLIITMWALMRIYILQRVWRRVVDACAVINIAAAADVTVSGESVSAFGEGLADGLDFGL